MPKLLDGDGRAVPTTKSGASRYGAAKRRAMVSDVLLPHETSIATTECINSVLRNGDAIMFSRTAGGGIVCVAVYSGKEAPTKLYAKTDEELADVLSAIQEAATG